MDEDRAEPLVVADVADSSGAGREAHLHGDACARRPAPSRASHGR